MKPLARGRRMTIDRGPRGERMVVNGRPGARVVSYGLIEDSWSVPGRPGYIFAHVRRGGGRTLTCIVKYHYTVFAYYHYVPAYYYGPRFYAWAALPGALPWPMAGAGGLRHPGSASIGAISLRTRCTLPRICG